MKWNQFSVFAVALTMMLSTPALVSAEMGSKCPMCAMKKAQAGYCPMSQKHGGQYDKGGEFSIKDKFFKKAHYFLMKKEALGLSEEQETKIRELKMAVKKDMIMKKAEIEVIALDIKSQLGQETIDTDAIHGLIDRKYELKRAKTTALVDAYAQLKTMVTDEQKAKLKESWGKKDKNK